MAIEVFNRYETKFSVPTEVFPKVIDELLKHVEYDPYNKNGEFYTISNIYYDTSDDILIRRSLEKPMYKEKLRLRAYGVPSLDDTVFLEIKKKFNGIVNKRRSLFTLRDAYEFIENGTEETFKPFMNEQVVHEIEYFLDSYGDLVPKVYIAYDRLAFFDRDNHDLRISFDTNIRTRRYDLRLDYGDYGDQLLGPEVYLMEIKSTGSVPIWLSDMLAEYGIKKRSFSKYGTEFKKYMHDSEYASKSEHESRIDAA